MKGRQVSFSDGTTWQPDFCFGGDTGLRTPKPIFAKILFMVLEYGAHLMIPASFAFALAIQQRQMN